MIIAETSGSFEKKTNGPFPTRNTNTVVRAGWSGNGYFEYHLRGIICSRESILRWRHRITRRVSKKKNGKPYKLFIENNFRFGADMCRFAARYVFYTMLRASGLSVLWLLR